MNNLMKKKNKKCLAGILCVMIMFAIKNDNIYAEEPLETMIDEKLEFTNARQYEMNLVLEDLGIKRWDTAPYSMDEVLSDFKVDEPLGEYAEEELKKYTSENFRAEFEYCCGYYGASYAREGSPALIQIARIYKDDELYALDYRVWAGYVSNASGVVPICHQDSYFTDVEDFVTRWSENENYDS